jgi:cell division protein FtsW
MTTNLPRASKGEQPAQDPSSAPAVVVAVRKIFAAETGNYFLLLGTTLFLVVFGLVMVLSSSAVQSFKESNDFFASFVRQGIFALIGIPLMLMASRMRAAFWRRWSGTAMIIAMVLQLLVVATPLGLAEGGNKNWIMLGSLSFQPSEVLKVALVIWLGMILAKKIKVLDDWRELMMPLGVISAVAIGLVVLGGDVGTAIVLVSIVFGAVFFAGVRLRMFLLPVLAIILAAVVLTTGGSRGDRISVWQSGCTNPQDYAERCWQTLHGWWALASGGVFGDGLGNSKAKWSWLPAADNDFIFAVIGEELGLLGAIVVLALLVVLAIAFVRIIRSNQDPFARITVSAIMVWILGQSFINIAVVLGLLPVLGVPLPLISAGGTSLVTTLFAIGIALSFARTPVRARAEVPAS